MPTGIYIKDGRSRGVEINVSGKSFRIKQTFEGKTGEVSVKKSVVGLPADDFFIKNVTIPSSTLNKKELFNAVKMQVDFHLPYDRATAFVSHHLRKLQKNHTLLITSTPRRDFNKPSAVIPDALALYSLAMMKDLLAPGRKSLIVYSDGAEVLTVMADGHEIVFMRFFPDDEDIVSELRLAAQAVYLREERSLIEVDRVIIFSETGPLPEKIKAVFSCETVIVKPSEILSGNIAKGSENRFLIPAGLALCRPLLGSVGSVKKGLRGWNVYQGEIQYQKYIIRGLIYTLPLWPLFITAYFYADVLTHNSRLEGIKGRINALMPAYKEAVALEKEVALMEDFLKTSGEDMKSPETWFEIMNNLNLSRPVGLWLTGISGKTGGTVLVSGKAPAYAQVTEYMSKLSSISRLHDLTLIFTQGSDKGVDFQISFKTEQKAPASKEGAKK